MPTRCSPAICLAVELALAVGVVVLVLVLAILAAHAAPEPWQTGCKIRTGIGVTAIVVGSLSAGAVAGFLAAALFRSGGRS